MKSFIYCVLVLIFIMCETEALNAGDKGACVARMSSMESRRRIYTVRINKMCGGRKCVAKRAKFEYYPTWKNHTICCTGWQHNSDLDVCEPVCSTGCNNGTCTAPEVCRCDPPLHLDSDHVNRCIPYTCDPPCVGGLCWGDNVCKCNPGLSKYNATHCLRCEEGFNLNQDMECVPICDRECVNGTCVAPNVCKCLDGYRSSENFICQPICDCVNADCVAPKTCSCHAGFNSVNATFCAPVCDNCDNGTCTEPGNCICNAGYTRVDGTCKPVCEKTCVNGICTAPNVCECNEGYVKNASNPEMCYRPCKENCTGSCDMNGVCQNGQCEVNNR